MTEQVTELPGNWVRMRAKCICPQCNGRIWDLGLVAYEHPDAMQELWWRLWGRRASERRIRRWNAHQGYVQARYDSGVWPDPNPPQEAS
jgi:hypothetical protein